MTRPMTRVLAVLELLQAHGQVSGAELAARLEVDTRTVRRYIATLEEMGIPVTAERGRAGGYALVAGFKLPPMMFSDDEALALSVGLLAARSLGLERAAPAIDETVQPGLRRANGATGQAALAVLSVAAQAGRRVRLGYVDAAGAPSERAVDTYGLAFHDGCWYAVGWCHLRREVRSFRLDRIRALEALDDSFERPRDFDALGYLVLAVATLPRAWTVEVLLKTSLQRAQAQFFDTMGVFEQAADGVLMHNQSDDIAWFARQLASLPFGFEIRRPPELRDAVRACAESLLRQVQ